MAFVPKTLDYTVSPYTGLTRQSWNVSIRGRISKYRSL